MAKKITGPRVVTANRLSDGMVVFLSPGGGWQGSLASAVIARGEDDAAALEAKGAEAVRANLVVDTYLIEIEETSHGLVPAAFRERRRVEGPSVNLEYNTRANGRAAFAA